MRIGSYSERLPIPWYRRPRRVRIQTKESFKNNWHFLLWSPGNFLFRRLVTKRCGFAPLRRSRNFSRIPAYKSTTYFFTTPKKIAIPQSRDECLAVEFSTAHSIAQAIPTNLLKLFKKTPSIAACGKSSSFMILLSVLIMVLFCLTSKVFVKLSVPKST